ncbi:MAG: efflux RND transporter permease subunit [Marinilabiliaceae bacterium]
MKNTFSINIIFLLLSIAGLALLPQLPVQLQPNREGETVHVNYEWHGMGADVLEKEVTSPIEGTLSSIRGVKKITSTSRKGRGHVELTFKEGTDMDVARFEVSSLMRSLHNELPAGVQLPRVTYNSDGEEDAPLMMIYTINGEGSATSLKKYVSRHIVPVISNLKGIERAQATGAPELEWEVQYNKEHLNNAGFSPDHLKEAIQDHLDRKEMGVSFREQGDRRKPLQLALSGGKKDSLEWDNVVVAKQNDRLVHLTDLASPNLQEARGDSYFRVNGLNTVYLVIHSARGANQLKLGEKIRTEVSKLEQSFPSNFSMLVNYDASEHIRKEVTRITSRAILAVVILLLFVLLISRRSRYLLIITLSLAANLCIAVLFYYMLDIEIHLYSLAGITVSLGIIIDNTIVMTDHIRHSGNRRAFLAILAATLTTMGAMTVIFFLKKEQQLNLIDFAIVMLINLSVSLAVALFFIPSLLDKLPLKKTTTAGSIKRKRRVARWTSRYQRFINFGHKWRWAFITVFILGFGLPVFLLPDQIETDNDEEPAWYVSVYNQTLGNETFVADWKPWFNKILGGSWYYFSNYFSSREMNWDDQKTKLYARAQMPDGSTIEQMNKVFRDFENFLSQFDKVDMFTSSIHSIDNASIEITFTPEAETGTFPHVLKQKLIQKANQTGGIDFSIYGVGRGFSNATHDGRKNNHLQYRGYNFDLMLEIARQYKDSLRTNERIQDVVLQTSDNSWQTKPRYEFVMDLNERALARAGSSLREVYNNLDHYSPQAMRAGNVPGDQGAVPVRLREENHDKTTVWAFNNNLLASENSHFRLKDVATITKERSDNVIRKEDQEYRLNVQYDFIGPYELNKRVRERWLDKINEQLPLGFSVVDRSGFQEWQMEEESQYWLLLIIVGIIFVLCSVLFESVRQPLIVIAAIPVSFIGLFLTFAIFKINFDQGGYAAMILLSGLTVNATLYIINDFNNLSHIKDPVKRFLKAFNHKIVPVLLTTISTILGLMPFLIDGKNEEFWFSLAAGAIGGLVFSIIAVVVLMPLIQLPKRQKSVSSSGFRVPGSGFRVPG